MSKFVRCITRHYGSACVCPTIATAIAATICICVLPTFATAQASKIFCVLVPHFKDEYWLSVGFGLEQEAAARNITLMFFQAGGYPDHGAQIEQLNACAAANADAILIGAVSSAHADLTMPSQK